MQGSHGKRLPKRAAQARQRLGLIASPELLTAGEDGTCGERSSRRGAAAPSAWSARHLALPFLQELLHAPFAGLGRTEAGQRRTRQGAGEPAVALTLASVTLNSRRMYCGMLYSAMGSTTKYWYRAERSAGQY